MKNDRKILKTIGKYYKILYIYLYPAVSNKKGFPEKTCNHMPDTLLEALGERVRGRGRALMQLGSKKSTARQLIGSIYVYDSLLIGRSP